MKYPLSIIRVKRKNAGLTIAELGAKLNPHCRRSLIGCVENGQLIAHERVQKQIADYFGVGVNELFDEIGRARSV